MGFPTEPLVLSPEQIQELNQKLSDMRHNINNNLALTGASVELIKRKPEMAERFLDKIAEQPERITQEMRQFTEHFERALGIVRDPEELTG